MDQVIEILKILIPAGLVLYGMFLTTKSFLNREMEKKLLDIRAKGTEHVLPNRLQAYERMCLFLERISPNNLITRLNDKSYSARQFQHIMVVEIREEFNHNLSQQLYMSDESWSLIKNTVEELISTINQAANELPEEAKSLDLARKVIEKYMEEQTDMIGNTLKYVKDEIRKVF